MPAASKSAVLPLDLVGFHALRIPAGAQRDRERLLGTVAPDAFDHRHRGVGLQPDRLEAVALLDARARYAGSLDPPTQIGISCAGFGRTRISSSW